MGYKLKVLSPVHIGCGEQYNAISYLLDRRNRPNKIYVLDGQAIFNSLNDGQKDKFVRWLEAERDPNLFKFLQDVLEDRNFLLHGRIIAKALYSIPCFIGNEFLRDINAFIKQMLKPYVPGTEIKGAIRTAILYCIIQDDRNIQKWLEEELKNMLKEPIEFSNEQIIARCEDYINDVKNQRRPDFRKKNKLSEKIKKIESLLQNKILNSYIEKFDAKYDILKFLQIGDSELISTDKLAVSYVEPFNISNRFKIFYEFLCPDTELMLTSFKLEDEISKKVKTEKMNLSEDKKNIISSINTILQNCKIFSDDLLEEEISYYSDHGKANIVNHLKKIKEQNTINSPVLRIGKDEGYLSLTVGLAVKKINPDIYENVLIHTTKNKSYDSNHGGLFPKSRKIVCWDKQELTSGWVKLIPYSKSDTNTFVQKNNQLNTQNDNSPDISSLQALAAKFGGGKR